MGPKVDNSEKSDVKEEIQNDREFRCKCKKTYKSYPALYTHIKNKHRDQLEEYKLESKRPKQSQIDKGRPKKHRARPIQADQQGDLLNTIELGVLEIQRVLRDSVYGQGSKFEVLVGNRKLQFTDLRRDYDTEKTQIIEKIREVYGDQEAGLVIQALNDKDLNDLKGQMPVKVYKESIKFIQELIQHFNSVTAAKIVNHIELLQIQEKNLQSNKINENNEITFSVDVKSCIKLGEDTLWGRGGGVIGVIRGTVKSWKDKVNNLNNNPLYLSNNESDEQQFQVQQNEQQMNKNDEQFVREENRQKQEQQDDQIMDYIDSNY